MTLTFIIWLLPAYIATLAHKFIASHRNQSGWDFIARQGSLSALFFVLANIVKYLANLFESWCPILFAPLRGLYAKILRWLLLEDPAVRVLPAAVLLAILYAVCVVKCLSIKKLFLKINRSDPFLEFTRSVIEREGFVLATLKSGKVYVGELVNATFDINESNRVISIVVELSGYREEKTKQVRFDKNYGDIEVKKQMREILIPFSEISTLAPFDFDVHAKFVGEGITLLGASKSSGSEASTSEQEQKQPEETSK